MSGRSMASLSLVGWSCLFLYTYCCRASTEDESVFELSIEELKSTRVDIASNVVSESFRVPVSITTIDHDKIRRSGARTLSEVLTLYVPGYMLVEDQDDTIAGFRGVVPDNNSKVMLLLDGVNVNTEWFWGPPDAVLNGLDMDFVERIEVIRGPGSVTLGQGALLGVINIVTRRESDGNQGNFLVSVGSRQLNKRSLSIFFDNMDWLASLFLSKGRFEGEPIRNEGWAELTFDQGLSVYQRQHHLKRGEYKNALASFELDDFQLSFFHFEQIRDLYNWKRDRESIGQKLDAMSVAFSFHFPEFGSLKLSAQAARDDYALYAHGDGIPSENRFTFESTNSVFSSIWNSNLGQADYGVETATMGGVREDRLSTKMVLKVDQFFEQHDIAVGAEWTQFNSGRRNGAGDNFLVNEEIQLLGLQPNGQGGVQIGGTLNRDNTWVKPNSTQIYSFFVEDLYKFNELSELLSALRYDNHPNWGGHISPRLSFLYQAGAEQTIRATWQTGFRGAVGVQYAGGFVQDGLLAQDNFNVINAVNNGDQNDYVDMDFDGDSTNDKGILRDLKPETVESLELAYTRFFDSNKSQLQIVLFHNQYDDIIAAEAHGYSDGHEYGDAIGSDVIGTWNGNWYYQNQTGLLNFYGLEVEFSMRLKNMEISASHATTNVSGNGVRSNAIYTNPKNEISAYPGQITRIHVDTRLNDWWSLSYHHLYYWGFYSLTGEAMGGGHMTNAVLEWNDPDFKNVRASLVIKNVLNEDALYPINATGSQIGSGAPALERRNVWFQLDYAF